MSTTYMGMMLCINMEDEEKIPGWAYLCPSCAVYYGIRGLVKALRKRIVKQRVTKVIEQ